MDLLWLLETGVWLAAVASVAPLIATPFLRREYWINPRRTVTLAAVVGLIGAITVVSVVAWPAARHGVAGALAAILATAWWRARPGYGRSRGLPPGSLGIRGSLDAILNPDFYLEQAGRYGPVFKMSEFGRPVVCILGLRRARTLLVQHAASLRGAGFWKPYHRFLPLGLLRSMTPEDHKAISPVFRTTFRSLDLAGAEPVLREIYRSAWARMAADSVGSSGGVGGLPYFQRATIEAVGYLFYGLLPSDPRVDELLSWMPVLLGAADRKLNWRRDMPVALAGATRLLRGLAAEWDRHPPDGFRPAAWHLLSREPAALDDPTLAGNFIVISRIAYGDLNGLAKWIFSFLAVHPESLSPVREATAATGEEPDPATRIVMETLRLEQSEYLYRRVARDIDFEGMTIPAGWEIRCCVHESHRDPTVFPEPDRFLPDRFAGRSYGLDQYAPFGLDSHGCMGADIAHVTGRLLVEELARGFHWEVLRNGPGDRGNRHRNHWVPSSELRVVMRLSAGTAAS